MGKKASDRSLQPAPDAEAFTLLSHDIRSAISDIVGGLRLIDYADFDAQTRAQMERVHAAGESLAQLMDDAMAALTGERSISHSTLSDTGTPLRNLLLAAERRWSGHALEQGMTLICKYSDGLPSVISTNRKQMDRILANLLGNALKYAEAGKITFGVTRTADDKLVFTVEDQGPGFSEAALESLFDYGSRPDDIERPGSGLGLHICDQLAKELGGRLEAGNRKSGGARVRLILPRTSWEAERLNPPGGALPSLSGYRVLVADDSPTNQTILSQMLGHLGAKVDTVENGQQALDALSSQHFDLALVDIEMPRLSGKQVISAVRGLQSGRAAVPILAVTAYVLRSQRETIYAAGADGILAKPIMSLATLGEAVASVLRKSKDFEPNLDAEPEVRPEIDQGGCDLPVIEDRARLSHLLEIAGPSARAELLDRLKSDLARTFEKLDTALAQGDTTLIRSETHVLISLAGAVGADRLQILAQELNEAVHRTSGPPDPTMGRETVDSLGLLIREVEKIGDGDVGQPLQ